MKAPPRKHVEELLFFGLRPQVRRHAAAPDNRGAATPRTASP